MALKTFDKLEVSKVLEHISCASIGIGAAFSDYHKWGPEKRMRITGDYFASGLILKALAIDQL